MVLRWKMSFTLSVLNNESCLNLHLMLSNGPVVGSFRFFFFEFFPERVVFFFLLMWMCTSYLLYLTVLGRRALFGVYSGTKTKQRDSPTSLHSLDNNIRVHTSLSSHYRLHYIVQQPWQQSFQCGVVSICNRRQSLADCTAVHSDMYVS